MSSLLSLLTKTSVALLLCGGVIHAAPVLLQPQPDTALLWDFTKATEDQVPDLGPKAIALKLTKVSEPFELEPGGDRGGLIFSNTTSLVPAARSPAIELPQNQVTIETWLKVNPSAGARAMGILQYAEYGKAGFRLLVEKTGRLSFLLQTGTREARVLSWSSVPVDRWVHVAATYDGKVMRLYVDGAENGIEEVTDGVVQPPGNQQLFVGYIGSPDKPFFQGVINSIRISTTARTKFDVK